MKITKEGKLPENGDLAKSTFMTREERDDLRKSAEEALWFPLMPTRCAIIRLLAEADQMEKRIRELERELAEADGGTEERRWK